MRIQRLLFLLFILCLCQPHSVANAQPQGLLSKIIPQSELHMQLSFAPVVRKSSPAVVNIYTTRRVAVRSGFAPLFNDPFFSQFFAPPPDMVQERQVNSLGSGVIVREGGIVVTSLHVVRGAEDIRVVLSDKREFTARLTVQDPASDLALLQLDTKGESLPTLPIMDADTLEVGDLVLAIGNPFGVGQTVTSGIVSGLARNAEGINDYNFFIQTDAAINPGNSGGALVNMQGELIGINSAIYSKTGGSVGVGFAIPSTMVSALLERPTKDGEVVRPYFGARFQDVTPEIASSLALKRVSGVLVEEVEKESPARRAGILAGDIIIAFQDKLIDSIAALQFRVGAAPINKPLPITVVRRGKVIDTTITLTPPPANAEGDAVVLQGNHPLQQVAVITLNRTLANHLNITSHTEGVVIVQVPPRAGRVFVRAGDIITECNGVVIRNTTDLQRALDDQTSDLMSMTLIRSGNIMQLRMSRG
jgi:serine protease Do